MEKELLEAAARAAGYELREWRDNGGFRGYKVDDSGEAWNPLVDDGDALRLAVALGLNVMTCGREGPHTTEIQVGGAVPKTIFEPCSVAERGAATRRAIVRAAAEIGRR